MLILADFLNLQENFYGLVLGLDYIVYSLIEKFYLIFLVISKATIFNSATFEDIRTRIYVIIGIVILFVIAFTLLKGVVDPDKISKGETSAGKLIVTVITSLALVILIPTIFDIAFEFQDVLLTEQVIPRLILNEDTSKISEDADYTKAGGTIAVDVFTAFFYPTAETEEEEELEEAGKIDEKIIPAKMDQIFLPSQRDGIRDACGVTAAAANEFDCKYADLAKYAKREGTIHPFTIFAEAVEDDHMNYHWFVSTIAGVLVAYMFLSYCIDLGIRVAKLGFHQLIAPIPILMRIVPGQSKMFSAWMKDVIKTYLDIFIKLLTIFLGVFMLQNLPDVGELWKDPATNIKLTFGIKSMAKIIIIFGILTFMKQAPKLLSEIFGFKSDGNGIGIMKKLAAVPFLGAAAAGTAAAVMGGARNAVTGARGFKNASGGWEKAKALGRGALSTAGGMAGGLTRGAYNARGAKNVKDVVSATKATNQTVQAKKEARGTYKANHGGKTTGAILGRVKDTAMKVPKSIGVNTKGNAIEQAAYADKAVKSFDDYKNLYSDPTYQQMESQWNQAKAYVASGNGDKIDLVTNKSYDDLARELESSLRTKRIDSIAKKSDAAAYIAYNTAQNITSNPQIAAQLGIDPNSPLMSQLKDLEIRDNKVIKRSTGKVVENTEIQNIMEGIHKEIPKTIQEYQEFVSNPEITKKRELLNQANEKIKAGREDDIEPTTGKSYRDIEALLYLDVKLHNGRVVNETYELIKKVVADPNNYGITDSSGLMQVLRDIKKRNDGALVKVSTGQVLSEAEVKKIISDVKETADKSVAEFNKTSQSLRGEITKIKGKSASIKMSTEYKQTEKEKEAADKAKK